MKPIKLNKFNNISIRKYDRGTERCIYCGEKMKEYGLGLYLYISWIHINCIDKFAKDIMKFKKKHIRDIMIESLTEKR